MWAYRCRSALLRRILDVPFLQKSGLVVKAVLLLVREEKLRAAGYVT